MGLGNVRKHPSVDDVLEDLPLEEAARAREEAATAREEAATVREVVVTVVAR